MLTLDGEKCDFGVGCGPPRWLYPAESFKFRLPATGSPEHESTGGWLACEACHAMIEGGDWESLAWRSVPSTLRPEHREVTYRFMRGFHEAFAAARSGPAQPFRGGT
jgi:hypothetical protein